MATGSRMRLALLLAVAPFFVSGCISVGIGGGSGKPLPSLMTLTPSARAPAGQTLSTPSAVAVVVALPEVDRTLETTRVPVQVTPTSVAYLTGGAWVEWPARLFRSLVAETIRAQGKRLVFEQGQPLPGSILLSGRLETMGYDAQARTATVRFDAVRAGAKGVISTRRFQAVEQNIGPNAAEVGPALNTAANDVARQVADWVDE